MRFRLVSKVYSAVSSRHFLWLILAVFLVSAVWIAFTGRYPMASDEDYHLGIIKLYAEQWSPFFTQQPEGADRFGALVRDPSFLHHYLMSFPYRLAEKWFNGNEYAVIMTLRLISVAMFAAGIVVFRKVLLAAKATPATAHLVLLFFVLTPIVPLVAAQINYDNLLFPLAALGFLLAIRLMWAKVGRVPVLALGTLLAVCMLASLTKYAYLPIFAATFIFLAVRWWRQGLRPASLWRQVRQGFAGASWPAKSAVIGLLLVSGGMFAAMYGYNIIRYAVPAPECDQVLGVERCKSYGAWNRNYTYAQTRDTVDANTNPFVFSAAWGDTYIRSSFFAINGIYSGFLVGVPLPVLYWTVLFVFWAGLALVLLQHRKLFQQPALLFFGVVIAVFASVLWIQNYGEYVRLGRHVAQQGRYLMPIMPLLYLAVAQAVGLSLGSGRRQGLKLAVAGAMLLAFTQGGGALTYIVRSDSDWWWQRERVVRFNEAAQAKIRPWIHDSHVARKEDMPGLYDE